MLATFISGKKELSAGIKKIMFLDLLITAVKVVVVMSALLTMVPILVWVERRGSAFIQDRLGPNRVGPLGLLQPVADAVKFIF